MKPLFVIARNEFALVARNPLVVLFMAIMSILAIVNAAGAWGAHPRLGSDVVFIEYLYNYSLRTSLLVILTMCLGLMSIVDERSKGMLRVLLTKPLYRRDVLIGKYVGISVFMLILITLVHILYAALIIAADYSPGTIDTAIRFGFYISQTFLYCCFVLGLVMLFGILFNKGGALIASLAFICYEWFGFRSITPIDPWFGALVSFGPRFLFLKLFMLIDGKGFRDLDVPLGIIFSNGWPYVLLLVLETIMVVLVCITIFNREET